VFGYDPKIYYSGRSPLEAASMGIPLELSDVTYRCNLVTLSEAAALEDAVMVDYSSGEITSAESAELIAFLRPRLEAEGRELYAGISYRHCLVLRNAADGTDLTPPHDITGRPIRGFLPKGGNGELLLSLIRRSYELLRDHPVNRKRIERGLNPASSVWFWGEGRKPALTPFREKFGVERGAVISAVDLVQGIGVCAGLECIKIPTATGNYRTDFAAKGRAAIEAFRRGCEFVYVHVEAPDECGHHGETKEKIYSIEQIDEKIMGPVLEYLRSTGEPWSALVMPDHPTPHQKLTHTPTPVPFSLLRSDDEREGDRRFTEAAAAETGLFVDPACQLMSHLLSPEPKGF
jgi:2,3-bisphosphoglycerate-independent phosphoglycerate mutase